MANEYVVINDDLRTMQIPSSISILGVESDDDVNKIPFQMPKEYCGFDLSTFEARINYMNANGIGDMYIVDDLAVDGDDQSLMTFTWLVGRNACAYKGNTKFIVCLKKFDNDDNVVQEFNTTVYNLPVLEGLETTDAVEQQNADVIEQILTMIQEAGVVDLSNYYTKAEVNALKLANPYPLTINGTEYDGSEAVELDIEGGSSQTTEIAEGKIVHVTDAVANEAVKALTLYDASGGVINSGHISVANKNLFRIDQIAQQTISKGITFEKNADGAIHVTGTSTGTYASVQVLLPNFAFVVGETYTISSGKTSGVTYVQLIMEYADGTTDYLVASNTPYTFTLTKAVNEVTGTVQITNSGVTVDEWIYPMVEVSDMASPFVMNTYSSMTYNGSTMPVLPDSISNVWSNLNTVDNIVMEYWNDPVMARINELEKEFNQTVEHDGELNTTSEHAVQNKVVTAALLTKVDAESGKGLSTNDFTDDHKAKLESIGCVTPEMFGAKGDGIADDTLALKQAFNTNNPCLLNGVYLYTETLTCPTALFGKGTLKHGVDGVYLSVNDSALISGVNFDGDHHAGSFIRIYNTDSVLIENCHMYNIGAVNVSDILPTGTCGGILINNSSNVTVFGCNIENCNALLSYGSYGIHITGSAEKVKILYNYISNIGFYDSGTSPYGDADGILVNSLVDEKTLDVDIIIQGNTLINCQKRALKLKGKGIRSISNKFIYTSDVKELGLAVIDFQRGNNESIDDTLIIRITDSTKTFSINNLISVCASNCKIKNFNVLVDAPNEYTFTYLGSNPSIVVANLLIGETDADVSIDNLVIDGFNVENLCKYFVFVGTATISALVSMNNLVLKNIVFSESTNFNSSFMFVCTSATLWSKMNSIIVDNIVNHGTVSDYLLFNPNYASDIANNVSLMCRCLTDIRPFNYYVASDNFIIEYTTKFNGNSISYKQNGNIVSISTDKTNIASASTAYANIPYRNTPVGTVIKQYPHTTDNDKVKIGMVCTVAGDSEKTGTFAPCYLTI